MEAQKLPEFLRDYFWDVKFEDLTTDAAPLFIVKRVIDRGNTPALRWLLQHYPLEMVKDLVTRSRDLSRKTANYWAKVFNLDPKNVPCLLKPYTRTPFAV